MKTIYVYVRNKGIIERQFNHKETTLDILNTLIYDYGIDFMSYSDDYIGACKMMLDEIYKETYML